ncbi:MAG: dephospho-CoA kinase [Thermodesulfobacteriota bacterium]
MVVGLTGGIASGKSLVSKELERLGAHVIDADLIAREVVRPGTPALVEIEEEFGPSVIKADGTLDRKALAQIVFSDPEKLKILNRITHPRIIERQRRMIEEIKEGSGQDDPLIVVDAAILIEAGEFKRMDRVVVVYADEEQQVERQVARNGITREQAKARVRAQMPLKEKLKYADYRIDNTGGIEETLRLAEELYEKLRR